MPFVKHENIAMSGAADWINFIKTVPDCSPHLAQRIARKDREITFFFYCRSRIALGNPPTRIFEAGDAVFFSGTLSPGEAGQCDTYVQNGLTVAYVGHLGTPGNSVLPVQFTTADGLNAIDIVCFCAANLRLTLGNNQVRLAPSIDVPDGGTLAVATNYYPDLLSESVPALQEAGISAVLSFQGDHDGAGWCKFSTWSDAYNFALQLQSIVNEYDLDGIDIDDEYYVGEPIDNSLAVVTSAIQLLMPGNILSKALFQDLDFLAVKYEGKTFWQRLTYGWEMSYGDSVSAILRPYIKANLPPQMLLGGFAGGQGAEGEGLSTDVTWLKDQGCRGVMMWAFESDSSQQKMGELIDDWCGTGNWNQDPRTD